MPSRSNAAGEVFGVGRFLARSSKLLRQRQKAAADAATAAANVIITEDRPADVSLPFWNSYAIMKDNLATDSVERSTTPLRSLAFKIQNPSDGELFKEALIRWRRHTPILPQAAEDTVVFVDSLLAAGAHKTLLDLACSRRRYSVHLTSDQILRLLDNFKADALENSRWWDAADDAAAGAERDSAHIQALDNMYKSFALLLYSSIPPNPSHYAQLITAGIHGGTTEGLRRSLITAAEQQSIGLPLTNAAKDALAAAHLRAKDSAAAAQSLSDAAPDTLKLEMYLALNELDRAVAALDRLLDAAGDGLTRKLALENAETQSRKNFSSTRPLRDVIGDLVAALESGGHADLQRTKELIS